MTTMTEETFWQMVKALKWPRSSRSTTADKISRIKSGFWTQENAKAFHDVYNRKTNALYKAFDDWEKENESFGLGDDSFSDLIAHVIGLGQAAYERNLKNPKLGYQRANKGEFTESFSYIIPFDDDFEQVLNTKSHFQKFAKQVLPDLKAVLDHPMLDRVVENDVMLGGKLSHLYEDMQGIAQGNPATMNPKAVKIILGDLMKGIARVEKNLGVKLTFKGLEATGGSFSPYGIENLYGDMAEVFDTPEKGRPSPGPFGGPGVGRIVG